MKLKSFFKERLTLLISVFFPAYMLFLHAPFEMYLTNSTNYWFGLADFWWLVVLCFTIVFLGLFIIGAFLPKTFRDIYSVLGITGGILVYIQGNFLNTNLGTLNGSEIIWSDYKSKFLLNACVWLLLIAIALILYFVFKNKSLKVLSFLAVFVFLVQVTTLTTLFINGIETEKNSAEASQYAVTDKDLYTVSKDQNVIIMLLDMFDNEYMRQIIDKNPEYKDMFKDFTFFDNAVGAYSTTCYSVGNFLTGTTVNNLGATFDESVEIAYQNTTMFDDLKSNDYLLDIYISDGYIPQELRQNSQNYEAVDKVTFDNIKLIKKLYRLVGCRFMPDGFKPFIWMNGTEFASLKTLKNSENSAYSDNNIAFYNGLVKNGLKLCDEKRFKFIHLIGTHYPYEMNSDLKPITPTSSNAQALDTAKGVLKIASTYIEELKKSGAYDNSTIVLVADHGFYLNGVLTNPLLMVKQPNTDMPFAISNAPVSHFDLHATIMNSINLNEDGKYGKSIFDILPGEERERMFYQYNLDEGSTDTKFRLIEYTVGSSSNARKNFKLTGYEYDAYGVKRNHTEECAYCLENGTDPVDTLNSACIPHYKK